ncbi:ATP-binding protein [Actinophytocola xanthii]|uniref:DNA topoisomerase (ATP-hydrolyzing) n=1 Tax=Actinophytocola xanthii TaxID=1912961 RepID=A0A1Q8CLZ3_9PSEU|nr:ATP-binding protein [Actinophytocola xanthii]OLF15379.1 ATP-binding protein [Actinophytocola xanthii]
MTSPWHNTTHDWLREVDVDHLERIRRMPTEFAPSGALHLVLEVLAQAADEAAIPGHGRAVVTLHPDGSLSIADDGRGTDTRVDAEGRTVRKPVMATTDLRFFDHPAPPHLPDGHLRRGLSVVAALSEWLVHTNHRGNGSWTQRYERGIPVTDLVPIPSPPTRTGTTVHFLPDPALARVEPAAIPATFGPQLEIELRAGR